MITNIRPYVIGGGVLFILVIFLFVNNKKQTVETTIPQLSQSTKSTSQNPQDVVPGLYKNPIQNTATKEGLVITKATVENNTDTNGKVISDHLELVLKNSSGKDLTDFEIYYTISDQTTNKKEGYYKKLNGFVLKNGQTQSAHFDNKSGDGHFSANKNSIYYTSKNKLSFTISVSAPGYMPQTVSVTKDTGGAEIKD